MNYRNPIIGQIINIHNGEANEIVRGSGSNLVKEAFSSAWSSLGHGEISASVSTEKISFNPANIVATVNKWISDFDVCLEAERVKFSKIEEPSSADMMHFTDLQGNISYVQSVYRGLAREIENVENTFANATRYYRSPMQQALNDIRLLHNDIRGITGDFSGFSDVSVYVHGIEDDGEDFLLSAYAAAKDGDIIVYEERDGELSYLIVDSNVNIKNRKDLEEKGFRSFEQLKKDDRYDKSNRLHIVYETEFKNEHRQKTSDDLASYLIDMGVLNKNTQLNMYAHSYGGRRIMQFAMDYPENVYSITTIGTPYDKNTLGGLANTFSSLANTTMFGERNSKEFSNYLDFNPDNQRTDSNVLHSNVYTDMTSEAMEEDINQLKVANPEAYRAFEQIEITAAAGHDTTTHYSYGTRFGIKEYETDDKWDGAVSVKSQHAESLGSLIDHRPTYKIEGESLSRPAHSFETIDEAFIDLIYQVNNKYETVE